MAVLDGQTVISDIVTNVQTAVLMGDPDELKTDDSDGTLPIRSVEMMVRMYLPELTAAHETFRTSLEKLSLFEADEWCSRPTDEREMVVVVLEQRWFDFERSVLVFLKAIAKATDP